MRTRALLHRSPAPPAPRWGAAAQPGRLTATGHDVWHGVRSGIKGAAVVGGDADAAGEADALGCRMRAREVRRRASPRPGRRGTARRNTAGLTLVAPPGGDFAVFGVDLETPGTGSRGRVSPLGPLAPGRTPVSGVAACGPRH